MMFLLIYNFDSTINEKPVCILKEGEHIVGRGGLLQCTDQRASRTHATIKVTSGNATILSVHQNPCFFQANESKTVIILSKDIPTELNDGDKFGIFADQYWFKVKICEHVSGNESLEVKEATTSHKRMIDEDIDLEHHKIIKTDDNNYEKANMNKETIRDMLSSSDDENDNMQKQEQNVNEENANITSDIVDEDTLNQSFATHNVGDSIAQNEVKLEFISKSVTSDNTVEITSQSNVSELESTIDLPSCSNNAAGDVGEKIDKLEVVDQASSSDNSTAVAIDDQQNVKVARDRCWYGRKCYRKNMEHRTNFSHPGDSDYESDPNDDRPVCSYGATCYRKNKDHRKEYKHPRRNRKRPPPPQQSSEDDYDYNDPFLTDGSEDEYSEESWSDSDDELIDSNINNDEDDEDTNALMKEDDEDTNALMKEAKRFTKQKK